MYVSLGALAAGLLVGQTADVPAADSGWTVVQSSTQTRTWTQSGEWTPATGWTWHSTSETDGDKRGEDTTFMSRVSDRLSGLFGSRQARLTQAHPAAKAGWQSTGWQEVDSAPLPVISARSPFGRVTTEEPPLLEARAAKPPTVSTPISQIKAASFVPAPAVPAPATSNSEKNGSIRTALLSKVGHAEDYSWLIGQIEVTNGAHVVHYAAPTSRDQFGGQMILNGEVDLSGVTSGALVTVHGGVIPGRTVNLYRVRSIQIIDQDAK